jgi:hypothetical protein
MRPLKNSGGYTMQNEQIGRGKGKDKGIRINKVDV